jgi:hypothetical protein
VRRQALSAALYFLLGSQFGCYSFIMNKHSVTKKRPAKPGRTAGMRKPSPRKASARPAIRKPEQANGLSIAAMSIAQISVSQARVGKINVSPVAAIGSAFLAHKFRVGQTVFYTSSPISRPGASGSYRVVRLLPSDGDDYQYRIKHAGEAFERVAKESQLELES